MDRQGGGHARTGDHLGHRARHRRGEGDDPRRARPAGRRRPRLPAARGRRDQHRHDRPEHLRRRAHRHLLHAARRATSRAPSRSSHELADGDRRGGLQRPTPTSRRSRSSAPACGATRASRPTSSRRSPTPGSTSRSSRRRRSASRASSAPDEAERAVNVDPRAAPARGRLLRGRGRVGGRLIGLHQLPVPDPLGHRLRLLTVDLPVLELDDGVLALAAQLLELVALAAEVADP